jgi:peroxiredoxin
MIKTGEHLPESTLYEFFDVAEGACAIGPNAMPVADITKGKKVVVFGLPGAFTPTCSAKHVPGFVEHFSEFKAKGVDEIWCVSVNDAFVMGAWARDQGTAGKVRMLGDGGAVFTRSIGLDQDLTARGMGVRSKRYAMVVDDGVVDWIGVEEGGQFEVSAAENVLKHV